MLTATAAVRVTNRFQFIPFPPMAVTLDIGHVRKEPMLTCIRELRSIALEWPLTGTGLAIARRNLEKNRDPLAALICRFRWKEEIPATWDRVRKKKKDARVRGVLFCSFIRTISAATSEGNAGCRSSVGSLRGVRWEFP